MTILYRKSMSKSTSWGKVASWYNDYLENTKDTFQKNVILPNLLRLMDIKPGQVVLDVACGQGFFSRELFDRGAYVTGADISTELIAMAKQVQAEDAKKSTRRKKVIGSLVFHAAPAHAMPFVKAQSVDKVLMVLALQNIENVKEVFAECGRVLKPGGRLYIVMNHPAYRGLNKSSWGWEGTQAQYRRVDQYLSESKVNLELRLGPKRKEKIVSFHRPLQYYFKMFYKTGFFVSRLEEWISHKKSEPGPRAKAEDAARKEIPLFICLEAVKEGG